MHQSCAGYLVQARLLPALLSALWTLAKLQFDPGAELMEAGAQLLTAEADKMVTQASLLCSDLGGCLLESCHTACSTKT